MARHNGLPSYRRHKSTGQAVVTLNGTDHYLGKYGTPESRERYDRLIAEWLLRKKRPKIREEDRELVSVSRIAALWLDEAKSRYVKNGRSTRQLTRVRMALDVLIPLYGSLPAAQFGPKALQAVRLAMIAKDWARSTINSVTGALKTMFDWAGENELIPGTVGYSLRVVKALRCNAPGVREPEDIGPVPWQDIQATLPQLTPVVRDLITLLYVTGMRPCEAEGLRGECVNRDGHVKKVGTFPGLWAYEVPPDCNKNAHKNQRRVVFLGPKAQRLLASYLDGRKPNEPAFSPAESYSWWFAAHGRHCVLRRDRQPGARYDTSKLNQAIRKACRRAGVEHWSANRTRHTRATEIRSEFGADAARVVLGHKLPGITGVYAEPDYEKAASIMRQIG